MKTVRAWGQSRSLYGGRLARDSGGRWKGGPYPTVLRSRSVLSRWTPSLSQQSQALRGQWKESGARSQMTLALIVTLPENAMNFGPVPSSLLLPPCPAPRLGDLVSFPHLYKKAGCSDPPSPQDPSKPDQPAFKNLQLEALIWVHSGLHSRPWRHLTGEPLLVRS